MPYSGHNPRVPTCWSRLLGRVIDYTVTRGLDPGMFYSRLALTPATVESPDTRVPVSVFHRAIALAARELHDPYFGLRYIQDAGFPSIDAVGFLARASKTIGDSLGQFVHYQPLISEAEHFRMELIGDRAVFQLSGSLPPSDGQIHATEMYAARVLTLIPQLTGQPLEVFSLSFTHPQRGEASEFAKRLGRVPRFKAAENEWSIPRAILELECPNADPVLSDFFEKYLQQRVRPSVDPVEQQVRVAIAEALPHGHSTLKQIAARMHVGERTLQRRLSQKGLSFVAILEDVRQSRAKAYLDMALHILEVSYLVGYAQGAAFHHAFRRWTGMTPNEWRTRTQPARLGAN